MGQEKLSLARDRGQGQLGLIWVDRDGFGKKRNTLNYLRTDDKDS